MQLTPYRPAMAPPGALLGGTVAHFHNVMDLGERKVFRAPSGATLRDVAPRTSLPVVCRLNGEYVLAEDWEHIELEHADHAAFIALPQGGGGDGGSIQQIIGIVLIVAGAYTGQGQLIAQGAAFLLSGLLSAPDTTAISTPRASTEQPSPTYSINLSGNTARLGQAIPVPYGRHIITPDFASNPYTEYDSVGDQYYYALFCFGAADEITVETVTIDDTVLEHFVDVETQYIGPSFGTTLTLVDPTVVNAPEVANQELLYGAYTGPFASSGAGLLCNKIGIDIICPKGLFFAADDGSLTAKTATWLVEARPISNSGSVAGAWFALGLETLTLAQNNPVRRTYTYTVTAGRYEVRAQRIDVKDTSSRAAHDVNWAGMRSYIQVTTSLDESANYLAVKIKATNQLSGLSQRRFAMIYRRKLPSWNPVDGWVAATETRSIAWALADVAQNAAYGGQFPDSRLDLQTLYELDLVWSARGDTFNGVFDQRTTVWEALTRIARCGRARPVMRGNVLTFVRDSQQDLPVALFNMRNIKRGSFNMAYKVPSEDDPDGITVSFFNEVTWAEEFVTLPLPGVVGDPVQPARFTLKGVTNLKQAQRETAYMAADGVYRPASVTFETELEGFLPALGELVAVSHDIASGWGVSGEIEQFVNQTAVCTEDLVWSTSEPDYALLTDEYGDTHGPYLVTAGEAARSMRFLELPDFTLYTGTERERTRFSMGSATSYAKLCCVTGIVPAGDDTVQISAVVEDNRVHSADSAYTGDGNIGGSGGGGGGGGGGTGGTRIGRFAPDGLPNYNAASDAQRDAYGFFTDADRTVGTTDDDGYVYDT